MEATGETMETTEETTTATADPVAALRLNQVYAPSSPMNIALICPDYTSTLCFFV